MSNSVSGNSKLNVNIQSGVWTFAAAAKTYTRPTTVSGGSLVVNTSLTSPVTVQAGAVFSGTGSTSGELTIETGAMLITRPGDWNSLPAAFSAAQLGATGATSWMVKLDAAGLDGFSESARTVPLVSTTGGLVNVNPAAITIQTPGFPGTGTCSVTTSGNALSLTYLPDLDTVWTSAIGWNGEDLSLNADPALLYDMLASEDLDPPPAAWTVVWSGTGASNSAGSVTVDDEVILPTPARRFIRLRVSG